MITNTGINSIVAVMAGKLNYPNYMAIGTGSSTVVSGNITLLTEYDRNIMTEKNTSASYTINYIADFNSSEVSGATITEYGLYSAGTAGSMFNRQVIGSLLFDGDSELQIQCSLRFSRSGAV